MKVAKMTAGSYAKSVIERSDRVRWTDTLYIHRDKSGDREWAVQVGLIGFADSVLCIGNYCGGGYPFCYEIFEWEDGSGLAEHLAGWLTHLDADKNDDGEPVVYADTREFTVFEDAPSAIVEIHEGMLIEVYSNCARLDVQLIDRDVTTPEDFESVDDALDAVHRQVENGELFRCW